MKKIIGIDLGTTNSCVSLIEKDQYIVIENAEGARTTPSIVTYTNDNIIVGANAKRQSVSFPKNTIYAAKRLIGRKYEEIKNLKLDFPFEVIEASNGDAWIKIDNKEYSPQQISSDILRYLKKCAEEKIGESIQDAIITVPAYFNESQRQATKDAGFLAGLNVVRIINEPTAAALAYGITRDSDKTQTVVVYDLGGGTLDVSIINIYNIDGEWQFEVLATNGDTLMGGEDFDNLIISSIVEEFKQKYQYDLASDPLAMQRLKEAAEKTKIELSTSYESTIALPYICIVNDTPQHISRTFKRSEYEQMCSPLIGKLLEPCKIAIRDAGLHINDISDILLVGGQTRAPLVAKIVQDFFQKTPRKDVNPDEAIAIGAAIQGSVLAGVRNDVLLLDVTPLSLGVETLGGLMSVIVPKNTTLPTKVSRLFSTSHDLQKLVQISIYQGERAETVHNHKLGELFMMDLPPAPAGILKLEVIFDLDTNGMLNVTVSELSTKKTVNAKMEPSSGMSEEQIAKVLAEAKEYEDYDKKRRELMKTNYEKEELILKAEAFLSIEDLHIMPLEKIKNLKQEVEVLKNTVDDVFAIKKNMLKLNISLMALSKDYFTLKS